MVGKVGRPGLQMLNMEPREWFQSQWSLRVTSIGIGIGETRIESAFVANSFVGDRAANLKVCQ